MSKSKNAAKQVQVQAAAFPFPTAKAMKTAAKVASKEAELAAKEMAILEAAFTKKMKPLATAIDAAQTAFVKANLETEVKRLVIEVPDFPAGQLIEKAEANLRASSTSLDRPLKVKFQDVPLMTTFYVDGEAMVKVGNTSAITGFDRASPSFTVVCVPLVETTNQDMIKVRMRKTQDVEINLNQVDWDGTDPSAFFSPERRGAWEMMEPEGDENDIKV